MAVEDKSNAGDVNTPFMTWLTVVDDFRVKGYQNRLPRWGYVLVLVAIIVTKEMLL